MPMKGVSECNHEGNECRAYHAGSTLRRSDALISSPATRQNQNISQQRLNIAPETEILFWGWLE